MNATEISVFVDRLESGKAQSADFRTLSPADWDEVKKLLEMRRQYSMQEYLSALLAYRMKYVLRRRESKRIYTEAEILAELRQKR